MAEQPSPFTDDDDQKQTDDDGFVKLTDDNGVQKKVILAGDDGGMTPPKFSTVQCHYVGRLLDGGAQFDSSRGGSPFEFKLGAKTVIRAWDIAVSGMKRNEICVVRCSPQYGYGARDDNEAVPANSWLEFEIELMAWNEWQYIAVAGNEHAIRKQCMFHTHNERDSVRCRPDDVVTLSFTASIPSMDNRVFDAQHNIQITVDDDDGHGRRMTDGFHVALQHLQSAEHAIVEICDYTLAYGAEGNVELDVPYFSDIVYDIRIHHIQQCKHWKEYSDLERMNKAKQYKQDGNALFADALYTASMKKYNKALRWLQYIGGAHDEQMKSEKLQLMIDVNNNIGLICMKQAQYDQVIEFSSNVLQLDAENVKALSRCGAAKIKLGNYVDAKLDLKLAKTIDADNAYVKKLWNIATAKVKQEKEKQRKQYQSLFGYRPQK